MLLVSNYDSREYITKNPIRSSIGSLGYGVVQGINLTIDTVDLCRDVVKLSRLSIKASIIETEIDAKKAELQGLDELVDLEAQLALKRAELSKSAK